LIYAVCGFFDVGQPNDLSRKPMTRKIYSPHDKFFKQALSRKEVALDFFKQHLPETIQSQMNFDTLEFCKETFIDHDLKSSAADLLYRLDIKEKPGYLYTLCEHQSTVDVLLAFRLLCYVIRIMQLHLDQTGTNTLPVVYCVVFYTGQEPYTATLDLFDLFGKNKELASSVMFKPYQLIDVNKINDEDLRKHVQAGLFEFVMKHIYARDFSVLLETVFRWIQQLEEQSSDLDYLKVVIKYALFQAEAKPQMFEAAAEKYLTPELEETTMTLAQHYIEEGQLKGVEHTLLALDLLEEGKSEHEVAEKTGLTLEQINKIKSRFLVN
jgi:predicted transposase/invertase (TIGR01784 family)